MEKYTMQYKSYDTGYYFIKGSYKSLVAARKAAVRFFNNSYDTRLIAISDNDVAGTVKRAFNHGYVTYIWCDYRRGMKLNILYANGTLGRECPEYKSKWNMLG